jgi:hypothetical protein
LIWNRKRDLVTDCNVTGEQAGQEDFALVRKNAGDAVLLAGETADALAEDRVCIAST